MTKKNKVRYQSKGNPYPPILLTGRVFLRHYEEEAIAGAKKGDLQVFTSTDALFGSLIGDYETPGFEGYLKADIFDGKGWKPLSLEEFFSNREYYFGKRERPLDTYRFCLKTFEALGNTKVMRTYREHYVRMEE